MVLNILQYKFYTLLFFLCGIGAFFYGFMALRRKRMVENIPTSKVRSIAMGLVELSGKAGCATYKGQVLCSPLTGVACAYFDFDVSALVTRGKKSTWVTIAKAKSSQVSFPLTDETGTVNVLPQGAEISIKPAFREAIRGNRLPEILHSFMERHNLTRHLDKLLLFTEYRIHEGQEVYIIGSAAKNDASPAGEPASGNGQQELSDIVIRKGEEEEIFMISDRDQEAFKTQLLYEAFGFTIGGALVALYTFWSILSYIRNAAR